MILDLFPPKVGGLGRVFKPGDPPKSPLKRGTLTEFSPLFKGGGGGDLNLTGKARKHSLWGASA
jgi:hypothetical protein